MLEKLVTTSTNYLIYNQVIEEDDRDVYEYGFHALYNNIIDIVSIVIIALFFNAVPQMIVYHISFVLLRCTAGGYHSKTHLRCFMMSTTILLMSLFIITRVTSPVISIGLACLTTLFIWVKAPIEHENNPMSKEKYNRMKKLCRMLSVIFFCIVFLINTCMDISLRWISMSLALGMSSHTILLFAAIAQILLNSKTP